MLHIVKVVGPSTPMPSFQVDSFWRPNTDIFETDQEFAVLLEIAGVSDNDLNIELQDNLLTISGVRTQPHREGTKTYRRMEINFGRFRQVLALPNWVTEDLIEAQLDAGFLKIMIAKQPVKKDEPRTIQIQEG